MRPHSARGYRPPAPEAKTSVILTQKVDQSMGAGHTDESYNIMKELGYDCKELSCDFDELNSRSEEIKALYQKFAA